MSLFVSPAFAEVGTPISVQVKLKSESTEPMTFQLPEDDVCFALQQLRVVLTNPAGKEQKAAPCTKEMLTAVTLPPLGQFERTVSMAKVFPGVKWGAGRWQFEQSWAARPDAGIPHGQVSMSAEPIVRAKALQTIKRGASVTLSDGSTFQFRAHGHKDVMPGQSSPLIVRGAFAAPGKKLEEFSANVMMKEERVLDLDGHVFELLDAKYDDSMKLQYFGRVKRED